MSTWERQHMLNQGFPTNINPGPHTCQLGLKAGRKKENQGSFIDFPKNFDHKTHFISHYSGSIELKIVIWYFLVSLFH